MLRCVYSWLGKFAASHSIQSSVGTAAGVEDARAKNKNLFANSESGETAPQPLAPLHQDAVSSFPPDVVQTSGIN